MTATSSSRPGKLSLQVYRNDVFRRHCTVKADGVDFDFTGYTARMQVRDTTDGTTTYLDLTTENGGITLDTGTIDLFADKDDMDFDGPKIHDLQLTPPDGEPFTLFAGSFNVQKDVTR